MVTFTGKLIALSYLCIQLSLDKIISFDEPYNKGHLYFTRYNHQRFLFWKTMLKLGDEFPNFICYTTVGKINFHEWLGNSWCIFFSHPRAFTPVCTTELGKVAKLMSEFSKRNCKVIGCSCDGVNDQLKWLEDIKSYWEIESNGFPYPIISDDSRQLAIQLGMIDQSSIGQDGYPSTCRAVFILDPQKKLRLVIMYPDITGRNFQEVLRVLDALQLSSEKKVATPVDWKVGESCIILPTVRDEDAKKLFPGGFKTVPLPSNKSYMRIVSEI